MSLQITRNDWFVYIIYIIETVYHHKAFELQHYEFKITSMPLEYRLVALNKIVSREAKLHFFIKFSLISKVAVIFFCPLSWFDGQ